MMIDERKLIDDFELMGKTYVELFKKGKDHLTELEKYLKSKGVVVTNSIIDSDANSFHFKLAGLKFKFTLEVSLVKGSIAFRNGFLKLYRMKPSDDLKSESFENALEFSFDRIGNIGSESIEYFRSIFLYTLIKYVEEFNERFPLESTF